MSNDASTPPPRPLRMPGSTLLTRLLVYDTPGPDGQAGGTPHLHLVCTEMYFVLSGSGAVELIDADGFRRVELPEKSAYLFSPGTVHRLVQTAGPFEILIVMQNSGLPERGDTIATFPPDVLDSDLTFHQALQARSLDDALARRDLAVRGFLELKETFTRSHPEGQRALERLYKQGRARSASRHHDWYELVTEGAFGEAQQSLLDIVNLQNGKVGYLFDARQHYMPPASASTAGFCGRLNRYFDPATILPEGVRIDA